MTYPATRNLTRYTLEKTSFKGWRLCISRQGYMFTKYFPDAAYEGDEEKSKEAALTLRNEILKRMETQPPREVIQEYMDLYAKPTRGRGRRKRRKATARRRTAKKKD